jgi:hypothetical protein
MDRRRQGNEKLRMRNRGMRKWNTEMLNIEWPMLNVEVEYRYRIPVTSYREM